MKLKKILIYVFADNKKVFLDDQVGMVMFLLNMVCFGLSIGIGGMTRVAALFGPYFIIYLPNAIESQKSKNKRILLFVVVIGICLVEYILRLKINNIGGTMPYKFR